MSMDSGLAFMWAVF